MINEAFKWDLVDVDSKTKKIQTALAEIQKNTKEFDTKNDIYKKRLQDKISADACKCIARIRGNSQKMLQDVTSINKRIHEANVILGDNETENEIKV